MCLATWLLAAKAGLTRDRQHGGRVQATAEQHNRFF
jgi:hypothetical protein